MVEYLLKTKLGKQVYVLCITLGFVLYALGVCVVVASPVWYPVMRYMSKS